MKNLPTNFDSATIQMIVDYAQTNDASSKFKTLASDNTGLTYLYGKVKRMCMEEGWTDESRALPHIEEDLM